MACKDCRFWLSTSRALDEESFCSHIEERGVRSYPHRGDRIVTPRDFECAGFQDAESVLSTERQLEKWFPIRFMES